MAVPKYKDPTTGNWIEIPTGGGGSGVSDFDDLSNRAQEATDVDISGLNLPIPGVKTTHPIGNPYCKRWLRFDPSDRQSLIIKGGTTIRMSSGELKTYGGDTSIDLSEDISQNGKDYFVNLADDGTISASTSKLNTGVTIGRFHTLCANVGSNVTMIAPTEQSASGGTYLIKPYDQKTDPDFYAFYNKTISSISTGSHYNVATMPHPLSGYEAGDILPESIFCLDWQPDTLYEDAMCYDKTTDKVIDIYLQSGTGHNTRSTYNATHTVSRQQINHQADMLTVGKQLLNDAEFTSMALGSNECTNIVGSSDKTTVGGHSDTNGRRMISAIGIEEACGHIWQWLNELVKCTDDNKWDIRDGQGSFGQEYLAQYALLAGGNWVNGAHCGSRCRASADVRSAVSDSIGDRGSSHIKKY